MSELIVYRCHGCENYCAVLVETHIKPKVCINGGNKQKWSRLITHEDVKKVGDD